MKDHILVLGDSSYDFPFLEMGIITHDPDKLNECKLVVFTGGEDVDPSFYKAQHHPLTMSDPERDEEEFKIATAASKAGIPMVGICRGAQLLTVAAGATLIQHCDKHTVSHEIHTIGEGKFRVTSSHHQMMFPRMGLDGRKLGPTDYSILAWAEHLSDKKELGNQISVVQAREPEVVYYHKIKALAVQYHPEWMGRETEGFKYFQYLVENRLGV